MNKLKEKISISLPGSYNLVNRCPLRTNGYKILISVVTDGLHHTVKMVHLSYQLRIGLVSILEHLLRHPAIWKKETNLLSDKEDNKTIRKIINMFNHKHDMIPCKTYQQQCRYDNSFHLTRYCFTSI